MGLFLILFAVGVLIVIFRYGLSRSGIKSCFRHLSNYPGDLLACLCAVTAVAMAVSCLGSFFIQDYASRTHQRFETVFDYELVALGSIDNDETYMKTRIEKYDGDDDVYVKFKFKDENGGVHAEEFEADRISVAVDPGSKPHVMKTVKWIMDENSFWIWDYRWGYEWSLIVPDSKGIEEDVLEEILVQQ